MGSFLGLFYDAISRLDYVARSGRIMDELERILKEAAVASSRYYPRTCLKGLRKTKKYLRRSVVSAQNSKQAPPEYECGALLLRQSARAPEVLILQCGIEETKIVRM
jgi:hypothetical protein